MGFRRFAEVCRLAEFISFTYLIFKVQLVQQPKPVYITNQSKMYFLEQFSTILLTQSRQRIKP